MTSPGKSRCCCSLRKLTCWALANCASPFGPITKPDSPAAAAPVSLVKVMAPASTLIEVPEKLAVGSKLSVSELSSVKDWPPLSTRAGADRQQPGWGRCRQTGTAEADRAAIGNPHQRAVAINREIADRRS